jgi:S-adenosylmethionine-diacylglycerol 3-amino-3-carboxypropyl transferase
VLARRGLSADYFKFDDGDASFAKSFYRRAKHVMTEIPIQSNYFLAGYLLGRYRSEGTVPDYLRSESYTAIQQRLDRITIVTADAKHWMAGREADSIDCLSLSNICELMDLGDTELTFREVARCARDGARLCFRNLMVPRAVPDRLADQIRRNTELSHDLLKSDRSFVYGKVDALEVFK